MSHFLDLEASYHGVKQFEHVRGGNSIHPQLEDSLLQAKLGGGDPHIERATAFWILILLLLSHVHLGGALEVAVADHLRLLLRAKKQFVKTQLNVQHLFRKVKVIVNRHIWYQNFALLLRFYNLPTKQS